MRLEHFKKIIYVVFAVGIVGIIWLAVALHRPTAPIDTDLPATVMATYAPEWNYRQGRNECGPFSAAAAIRALGGDDVSSSTIVSHTPWRLRNGYTAPWGVEEVVKRYELSTKDYSVARLSDDKKIAALQTQIAQGNVAILLGEIHGVQHFITVLGYDLPTGTFLVYDPLLDAGDTGMTVDNNGDLPGNNTMSEQELLAFWNAGGIKGFFRGYLLSVER